MEGSIYVGSRRCEYFSQGKIAAIKRLFSRKTLENGKRPGLFRKCIQMSHREIRQKVWWRAKTRYKPVNAPSWIAKPQMSKSQRHG